MEHIRIENLYYSYENAGEVSYARKDEDTERQYAIRGIDLTIEKGQYVAVVGANGCGKTTLLKHLNALLVPTSGDVWISGFNTREPSALKEIRGRVGMVFQNPETQIITTLVEDEVAFGPENLGMPEGEIRKQVEWAMEVTGITKLKNRPPHLLSAGQKQLLAVASVLAMLPGCLVLDEATSMLDPASKKSVLDTVRRLHESGMTVVLATNSMEEAAYAQRIIVLSKGSVAIDGDPATVFSKERLLKSLRLEIPSTVRIAKRIERHIDLEPQRLVTVDMLVSAVAGALGGGDG
jgi:energy-coupling factor transporter ATPase